MKSDSLSEVPTEVAPKRLALLMVVQINARGLKCSGNIDRVTCMPVVSAEGVAHAPVFVLQGKKARYRDFQLSDRTVQRQTPADVLPSGCLVFYRDPPSVDAEIVYTWAIHFVEETTFKRNRRINQARFVVLVLDGYSGHIQYKTLSLLRENNIVVLALPAHTSHRTQVLDYTVFAPLKTEFRSLLDGRCMNSASNSELNNNLYTFCEFLSKAYFKSLSRSNIVSGFKHTGVWNDALRGPDSSVLKDADFTANTSKRASDSFSLVVSSCWLLRC
jgi:hypothetical protein